jgi:hypothetical protein
VAPTPAPVTPSPVTPAPTDAEECVDSDKILELAFAGSVTLKPCQYLIDFPVLQGLYCTPNDPSGAYEECRKTCGNCPSAVTDPPTPTPVTSMPIELPTAVADPPTPTPTRVTSMPIELPTAVTDPPTPTPVTFMPIVLPTAVSEKPILDCNDTEEPFFLIFAGVSSLESCASLAAKPDAIPVACNGAANALVDIKSICPKTCNACGEAV